ncbi:MAG: hypothetical protein N4A72_00790 [Bacteroidales bacterium]|jgi:hypothetical protein|nr:hypothetical protein [Bacteroidales bacterium]
MKRTIQIDIKGFNKENNDIVEFNLIIAGRSCRCYMHESNYQALMYDGVFVRDGKSYDSAGVLNTTRVFEEKV